MKYIILVLSLCCTSLSGFSQRMEEILFPQYVYYSENIFLYQTIPYVFKARLTGLQPSTTYFYCTQLSSVDEDPAQFGNSGSIVLNPSGDFTSCVMGFPIFFPFTPFIDGWTQFTTDAQGTYTGWFATETYAAALPAKEFYLKIAINDGAGGEFGNSVIRSNQTVKAINFNPEDAGTGRATGIRSTPAAGGTAKNMVFVYDNEAGAGRPLSGAFVQDAGLTTSRDWYFDFYRNDVFGKDRTWGTLVPNDLPNGVRRIEQYGFSSGSLVGFNTSSDGVWDGIDGTVNTVNPTGGSANPIVINGTLHDLLQDRQAQTITFAPLPDKTYGDAPFPLTASASSGLTDFTFTSSDPAVASITGNTVTVHKPGTTTITATQPGNASFMRGTASQSLTVNPAGQMITFDALPAKAYGDASFTLDATASSGLPVTFRSSDESIAVVNGNTVTIKKAGMVDMIASQAGNINFPPAPEETRQLLIARAPLTITADHKSKAVGEANPVLTFQYTGFRYLDNLDSLTTPVEITTTADQNSPAGDYQIVLSGASSPNYEFIFTNGILSVYSQTQSITWTMPAKVYGDAPFDAAAISTTGAVPVYSTSDPRVATIDADGKIKITGAGAAYITATFPAANGLPVTTSDRQLTVAKAGLTITPAARTRKYGAADPVFTANYTGFVYGDGAANLLTAPVFSTAAVAASPVGDYAITAGGAVSGNYAISYQPGTLTIEKAALTAIPDEKVKEYGQPNPALTISYFGFMNGEDASVITTPATLTTAATTASGVGDYPVIPEGAAAQNYEFSYQHGILKVIPAPRSITFEPLPVQLVGSTDFDPGATATSREPITYSSSNTAVATIVNGQVHVTGAGKTTISATIPANPNYTAILPFSRTLVVKKGIQQITIEAVTGIISGQPYTLPATTNAGLPIQYSISDAALATLSGNQLMPLRAGVVRVKASQAGNDAWLPATAVEWEIRIVENNLLETWASSRTQLDVRVVTAQSQKVSVQLYTLNGQQLFATEKQLAAGSNSFRLPIGSYPTGAYLLQVKGEHLKISQRVIIH